MPIQRRLPKRGFKNPFRKTFQIINLSDIERVGKRENLDPQTMIKLGLIRKISQPVKVLGDGKLSFAVNVSANAFSANARQVIEAAGGKVEVL